jgi:hypothetical protein
MATRPEVNVASASIPKDRWSARIALVEHHIRLENEHDLEGVLRTFGILVEVVVRGTHLGWWRGLPATGRRIEFPLSAVCAPSATMTVLPGKKSITTAELC